MKRRFIVPCVILALVGLPVLAGLAGTIGPAFGYLPALGGDDLTFDHIARLAAQPHLVRSALISLRLVSPERATIQARPIGWCRIPCVDDDGGARRQGDAISLSRDAGRIAAGALAGGMATVGQSGYGRIRGFLVSTWPLVGAVALHRMSRSGARHAD